jgi:hypothetical protein
MAAAYLWFTEARQKLVECRDFARLREARHKLTDGVVLTSVSDVPFEMSFKCMQCAEVFWFENLSWREGGFAEWRLDTEHQDCVARPAPRVGTDYTLRMHP